MTRPAGQVTLVQSLAGAVLIVVVLLGIVATCGWLLIDAEVVPTLPAPGDDDSAQLTVDDDECPAPETAASTAVIAVTSSLLIECPNFFDGRTVTYTGEAVGAVLRRTRFAWVQLNDDPYALAAGPLPEHRTALGGNSGMAVAVPLELAARLGPVGGFERQGPLVAVVGEFHRTDPADGGAPTIHAEQVEITRESRAFSHDVSPRRIGAAIVMVLITAATSAAVWIRQRTIGLGPRN